MDSPFESPVVLSFCPGFLGLERGFKRVVGPIRVAAYVENEAFIDFNLLAGMEAGVVDTAPIWTDATTFDARPFRGRIHWIIGGYPCPGESLAGLREGHLYKGFIWPSIRRAVAAARPLGCFFENVDDHLTGTYPIVQRSLRNMGYAVEAGVFSAEEVGASHERQRLFVLAMDNTYLRKLDPQRKHIREVLGLQEEKRSDFSAIVSIGTSKKLGNTIRQGLAERQEQPTWEKLASIKRTSEAFPKGQGYDQWDWEERREIESGLEYTIERYNFTEDLLRANGNMVVEQQAQLAFRTLLLKFT